MHQQKHFKEKKREGKRKERERITEHRAKGENKYTGQIDQIRALLRHNITLEKRKL